MVKAAILAFTLLGAALPAAAGPGFLVRGDGAMPCTYLTKNIGRPDTLARVQGWIEGYLTARNQMAGGAFDVAGGQPVETVIAAVRRACKNNPNGVLYEVTQSALVMAAPR